VTKRRYRYLALGLIITGVVIIALGTVYLLLNNKPISQDHTATLPEQVANLPLTGLVSGEEGVQAINQLHDKVFPLKSGVVGSYGQDNNVTIWAASAADISTATQILMEMRDRIAEGNSPFTPTGEMQTGNRTIYILDGLGQLHFYFQSGKQVIWLASDAPLADQALRQVLEYYP
jgi:hypothetical protein